MSQLGDYWKQAGISFMSSSLWGIGTDQSTWWFASFPHHDFKTASPNVIFVGDEFFISRLISVGVVTIYEVCRQPGVYKGST
jgi:hypothetical protein